MVEVAPNKFAVGCWGVPWVALVDKNKRSLVKVNCPLADESQTTDLIKLPGFDLRNFPCLILRNSKAINLVNLANLTMHRLLQKQNQSGSFEKMVLDFISENNDQLRLLFATKDSTIMEARIQHPFLANLRDIIAKSKLNQAELL